MKGLVAPARGFWVPAAFDLEAGGDGDRRVTRPRGEGAGDGVGAAMGWRSQGGSLAAEERNVEVFEG
jgi:hypothetical protein